MSAKRRGGLGRGIGALIPTAPPHGAIPRPPATAGAAALAVVQAPPPEAAVESRAAGLAALDEVASNGDMSEVAADEKAETDVPVADSGATGEADTELRPVPGAEFAELPIDQIHPNSKQPRQVFDEQSLEELTYSIREFGVLQPVVVRVDPAGGYELVMGERRLRASAAAELSTIPAIIRSTADDAMLRDALLENIHRAQLNPLEEAAAYQQLLEDFGVTHDELARRIGRSRSQVSNTIRLMNLSVPVQRRVAAGVLSAGHARALLGLEDADAQDELATRIVAEGLSVRATEELVAVSSREAKPTRRSSAPRMVAPGISDLSERLSDAFDTRVMVSLGRRKGKITVEFGSVDDLERIVGLIAPSLGNRGE